MTTNIPEGFLDTFDAMKADNQEILSLLSRYGIEIEKYPDVRNMGDKGNPNGIAAAKAYPIQGVLKYHGMADWSWRTAFLPSISVNNDAGYSLTLVEFRTDLADDVVLINGTRAQGRELERVQQCLKLVRSIGGIESGALVTSRNWVRSSKLGKGLGTSASASAALAMAALAAAFGETAVRNTRFLSTIARLLAGSGGRSSVGGVSLWLSYPGIAHEDSFSVRLDTHDQLADLRLITMPIDSRINLKTEMAHSDAPNSPFFKLWMHNRLQEIKECIPAIQQGDWKTVAQWAEFDSIQLHSITMSGSRENKIFAWEPENIYMFRICNELRSDGVPVYFSTDTGPTIVFFTHKDFEDQVIERIKSEQPNSELIRGKLAGPSTLVDIEFAKKKLEEK